MIRLRTSVLVNNFRAGKMMLQTATVDIKNSLEISLMFRLAWRKRKVACCQLDDAL